MHLDDPQWQTWSQERYPPIAVPTWTQTYGSGDEPLSSLWCASLAHGFGPRFAEGVKVLDYGCGGARFANFLSRRLLDFVYIGVEPPNGSPLDNHTCTNLQLCEATFGHDSRVRFGTIGSDLEAEAIERIADVIVAGSIFTHLPFSAFREIVGKFQSALQRGGDFVFSVFIGDEYIHHGNPGLYGVANCWPAIVYTQALLDELAHDMDVEIVETGIFWDNCFEHHILRMSKRALQASDLHLVDP